ncbi:hypothetical protein [Niveibacterium sp.]|uniref:hypothetical protein n=1 Tax=Niveibacterium sp. TaxID=2017444 RepID=UPI0035B079EF
MAFSDSFGAKTRQSGFVDGVPPLIALLIVGAGGLLIAVLLASVLIPAYILRSKKRYLLPVVGVVLAAWGWLYWDKIGRSASIMEWQRSSQSICEAEVTKLPTWVSTNSLLIEDQLPTTISLVRLLTERQLDYVEIKTSELDDRRSCAAVDDLGSCVWMVPSSASAKYVRLELADDSDPQCFKWPYGVTQYLNQAPIIPGFCITLIGVSKPTSDVSLHLHPAPNPEKKEIGAWVIEKREAGTVLARMPTPRIAGLGEVAKISEVDKVGLRCEFPSWSLINLVGRHGRDSKSPFALREKRVTASQDVRKLAEDALDFPTAPSTEVLLKYATDRARDSVFHSDYNEDVWRDALNEARREGFGSYGHRLVDWDAHAIVAIDLTPKEDASPWEALAVGKGFVAFRASSQPSWYDNNGGALFHFLPDGTIDWKVRIISPLVDSAPCHRFTPTATFVIGKNLHLAGECQAEPGSRAAQQGLEGRISVEWTIRLDDLPGRL